MAKKLYETDVELLNSQSEYKNSFIFYVMGNSALSLFFKILGTYILSMIMAAFELFDGYAFFISYVCVEIIFYNLDGKRLMP
ncbi:MAG: hypothetical protein PHO62_07730 [Sulfurimonas sp.]|uniref:hypothetical protein n=1 Tax=Sulfurimonas sp. TaxID=2022749 RepID=UPI002626EB6A|nr:hypothetical protein [Sulfurimonas sp.]MDD5373296.1 hypothetical protein [Sulfurimonas sp.]